jgi:serine/threonine-protein kinase HipA
MLNVSYHGQRVGQLDEGKGRVYFVYDPAWLAQGHELSPLHLARKPGTLYHHGKAFDGLPGLFWDSLPDSWGAKLMELRFTEKGIQPKDVTRLMRLAYVGQRGIGALTYEPSWPETDQRPAVQQTKLIVLERESREVVAGAVGKVLPHLLEAGGTAGGAQPKVLVGVNDRASDEVVYGGHRYPAGYTPWLIKFDLTERNHVAPLEQAYAAMARSAGVAMPETRLFTVYDQATGGLRQHFGARRFDRDGDEAVHFHSFAGVAHRDPDKGDYRELLLVTKALTRDMAQVTEAFRRMVFNVVASNRDDHGKNHGFLYRNGQWTVSPAFDVTYVSPLRQSMRGMAVAGEWSAPGWAQLQSVARDAGLEPRVLRAVTEQVAHAVTLWPHYAEQAGVPAAQAAEVKTVLAGQREILAAGQKITVPPPQITQAPEQSQSIPAPRPGPRMSM